MTTNGICLFVFEKTVLLLDQKKKLSCLPFFISWKRVLIAFSIWLIHYLFVCNNIKWLCFQYCAGAITQWFGESRLSISKSCVVWNWHLRGFLMLFSFDLWKLGSIENHMLDAWLFSIILFFFYCFPSICGNSHARILIKGLAFLFSTFHFIQSSNKRFAFKVE